MFGTMDSAGVDRMVSDNAGNTDIPETYRSELLCFLQQKAKLIALDQLVKLTADFYRSDEILSARSVMEQYVPKRITKRQGSAAMKATVEDLLKLLLDPTVKVPTFFAVDLCRLPPVGVEHCDVSAILQELHSLRMEVRMITQVREELNNLRQDISALKTADVFHNVADKDNWPSLQADVVAGDMNMAKAVLKVDGAVASKMGSNTFAGLAQGLQKSGMAERKPRREPVIGSSKRFSHVKAVQTKRQVDVFVSRWNPHSNIRSDLMC